MRQRYRRGLIGGQNARATQESDAEPKEEREQAVEILFQQPAKDWRAF
jgi:hypothetical protein